jgi:hypothetical protein
LTGKNKEHPYIYWEFNGDRTRQAIRQEIGSDGNIKRLTRYNLKSDISEAKDLSKSNPQKIEK